MTPSQPRDSAWTLIPLRPMAIFVAACAFLLLIAGGLVTSTGSGLSVPDWPLSFGTFFPPMRGGVLFEHGHRLIAGTVALMTLALFLRVRRGGFAGPLRALSALALAGILIQAALGGATVLLRLPPAVSVAHACLGEIVFCLLASLADLSSRQAPAPVSWRQAARPGSLANWSLLSFTLVFAQVLLGAVLRHTGLLAGWHIALGALVFAIMGVTLARATRERGVKPGAFRTGLFVFSLLPVQIVLGILSFLAVRSPSFDIGFYGSVALRTAHVACGALVLAGSWLMTIRSCEMTSALGSQPWTASLL